MFKQNLINLTKFLNLIAEKEVIPGGEIYLNLNTFIKEKWDKLNGNII